MALIELREVTKSYKRDAIEIPVLERVTITVADGDFLGLMGPSGAGQLSKIIDQICIDGLVQGSRWQFSGGSNVITYSLSVNDVSHMGAGTRIRL